MVSFQNFQTKIERQCDSETDSVTFYVVEFHRPQSPKGVK